MIAILFSCLILHMVFWMYTDNRLISYPSFHQKFNSCAHNHQSPDKLRHTKAMILSRTIHHGAHFTKALNGQNKFSCIYTGQNPGEPHS